MHDEQWDKQEGSAIPDECGKFAAKAVVEAAAEADVEVSAGAGEGAVAEAGAKDAAETGAEAAMQADAELDTNATAEPKTDATTGASPGTAQACDDLGLNSLEANLGKFNIKPPGVA